MKQNEKCTLEMHPKQNKKCPKKCPKQNEKGSKKVLKQNKKLNLFSTKIGLFRLPKKVYKKICWRFISVSLFRYYKSQWFYKMVMRNIIKIANFIKWCWNKKRLHILCWPLFLDVQKCLTANNDRHIINLGIKIT